MVAILITGITSAVSTVPGSVFQLRAAPSGPEFPTNMCLQGTFAYGSSGTSVSAIVQTSLDGQTTWCDVANFSFSTSSGRTLFNLNSSTSHTTTVGPSNGTLAGNTSVDGIFGNFWRVLLVTQGTYAGNTSIRVDAVGNGLTVWQSGQ